MVVKKTSRYPRVMFLGDFEFRGSSAAKLTSNSGLNIIYNLISNVNLCEKYTYSNCKFIFIIKAYLADETIMQTKMKFVNTEWLQKLWQNTRMKFVWLKMKKDEASGIGTILFMFSGSSSSLSGSINSPIS